MLIDFILTLLLWNILGVSCTFKLPDDLTFLGCIFTSPAFNETSSLFPEVAVRSSIPVETKDIVSFCRRKAKKNGHEVFGVYKKTCITGSKLKFALPVCFKSKKQTKCMNDIKIFSFSGQLDGIKHSDEIREEPKNQSHVIDHMKRQHIEWTPTKRNLIETDLEEDVEPNLFVNNDFENTFLNSFEIRDWTCQGEFGIFIPMYRKSIISKSGHFSGYCSNRLRKMNGPGQHVVRKVLPGEMYTIEGWTYLVNAKDLLEAASLELWIKYISVNDEYHEKKLLAKRDIFNDNNDWQFWKVQFLLPKTRKYQSVFIYFQGPPKHVDIGVDAMNLFKIPKFVNFKSFTDREVEKVRKRNVTVSISFEKFQFTNLQLEKARLEVKQISSDFAFGVSVDIKNLLNNAKYKSFIKHNFNWATMESSLKWDMMEKSKDFIKYYDVDRMLDTLVNELGMSVRGHCVYWALAGYNPPWLLKQNQTSFKTSMNRRMRDLVWKYKDKFKHWDVNNEMLHGWYYTNKLRINIRKWMYKAAKKLDANAKLFVNDFDVFASPTFTQSYVEQITNLLQNNVPIEGIGVQAHFSGAAYPELLKERLDMLGKTGLPIWITEFDVKEEDESKRADIVENVLRIAFSHPSVAGFMLWTFWDKHSWRGNYTSLFDGDNFMPNASGRRYLELRKKWRTPFSVINPSRVTKNRLDFNFRVFHGKYNIKIMFPDGQMIEKIVQIENHWKQLLIQFKTKKHVQ